MTYSKELKERYDFKIKREKLKTSEGIDVGKDALIRVDTKQVLGIVSPDKYKIVTHKAAIESLGEVLDKVGGFTLSSVDTILGGAMMYAKFKSDREYEIGKLDDGKPDLISPVFTVSNSFNRYMSLIYDMGAERLICSNGLKIFKRMPRIRNFHVGKVNPIRMVGEFEKILDKFEKEDIKKYEILTKAQVTSKFLLNIIKDENLNWKFKDQVLEALSKDGYFELNGVDESKKIETEKQFNLKQIQAWYLYNVFTYVLTHGKELRVDRRVVYAKQIASHFDTLIK